MAAAMRFDDQAEEAANDDVSKLTADGGEESPCGWLKDKYGFSWQIIPRQLMEMIGDRDHPGRLPGRCR